MSGFSRPVVERIVERDQSCCVRCGASVAGKERGFAWSIHHRRPRGMGGSRNPAVSGPANGLTLCGSGTTGCHGWAEAHRTEAISAGLIVAQHGDPELVPVLNWLHGAAFLSASSGWWPAGTDYRGTDYLEHVAAERGVPADSAEYLRLASVILDGLQRLNGPAALERDLDADEAEVVENAWDREWEL